MNADRIPVREAVLTIAERLRDPTTVGQVAAASASSRPDARRWRPGSLSCGHGGIALLFAELAHADPDYVEPARAHLAEAARHHPRYANPALHDGLAGLGLVAHAVARSPRDCAAIITACVERSAPAALAAAGRIAADPSQITMDYYDAISGLAGTGRFLLRVRGPDDPAVRAITSALVALAAARRLGDTPVPGWLAAGSPSPTRPNPGYRDGHLNLGLAHGIAGPLAYLAVASTAGVRVPGLCDAIHAMGTWLVSWYRRVPDGRGWPSTVSVAEQLAGDRAAGGDRGAWCYGAPGIARSLQLAALAGGDPAWASIAVEAITVAFGERIHPDHVTNVAFCHGWAGLLRTVDMVGADAGSDPVGADAESDLVGAGAGSDLVSADASVGKDAGGVPRRLVDDFAGRLLAGYRPDAPWLFRFDTSHGDVAPADAPGLLDGAAGVALALWAYLTGGPSATGWEDAFLLS